MGGLSYKELEEELELNEEDIPDDKLVRRINKKLKKKIKPKNVKLSY